MVVKIEELKKYAEGHEIELSGFVYGENFTVKLKRPSLVTMAQSGSIPNPLLGEASALFKDGINEANTGAESFKNLSDLLIIIAKDALLEPTYEEFEKAGLTLTDVQLMQIYNFANDGIDRVKFFRKKQESDEDHKLVGDKLAKAE